MTHLGMSIVSVNEWDTFKNIFSQNGIGDLIRQEIKVLRKLYFIKQITEQNKNYFTYTIKKNLCSMDNLFPYQVGEIRKNCWREECNLPLHYTRCLKCYLCNRINECNIPYKVEKTFETLFSERLWCFKKYKLGDNKFNELSYEEKMKIFKTMYDLRIEYLQRENADISDNMYLLDIRPCENRSPIEY